jgi:hypothetical protein
VLALLKPSILNSVRESYAEIVAEGVLSKKRLKSYFDALPGKTSAPREIYTIDLSNYQPVTLRSSPNTDPINSPMKPTQAKGVDIALSEILPVVSFHNNIFFYPTYLHIHPSFHPYSFFLTKEYIICFRLHARLTLLLPYLV